MSPFPQFLLVTDATADQVQRRTGLFARDTHLGALVEKPRPYDIEARLDALDRALHPRDPRCHCARSAVIHSANCPLGYISS